MTATLLLEFSNDKARSVKKTTGKPETDFPRSIGRPATSALIDSGYTRYDHLTKVTAKNLLGLHGVGPKAVRILDEELASRGLSFAAAPSEEPKAPGNTAQGRD